ncbi:MarR family winged helix-turn-helix transcriptional regulator [Paenibacillus agricola]|uniref:MarR family transcriptional regulator n=1 Tax=Paenibacillus agricola TaxID=2716264 RepID=A0ABX0IYV2_9BACL|nr:MarR family transcriptional regulator [Paenibacillus agricola]NHN29144.1 MarR family transcriptional regulator [Paenibacillus agricola]
MSPSSTDNKETIFNMPTVTSMWRSLMELNRQVKQMIQQMSTEVGISCSSVCLIFKLEQAASMKMNDIADYLSITVGAATSLVDKLESQEWIERIRSIEDRRIINVRLSDKGMIKVAELRQHFAMRGEHIFDAIPKEQLVIMEQELGKINILMKDYNQL